MNFDLLFAILFAVAVIGLVFVGYKLKLSVDDKRQIKFIVGGLLYINSQIDYNKQEVIQTTLEYLYEAAKLIGVEEYTSTAELKSLIIAKSDWLCEKNGVAKIDFNEPFIEMALDYVISEIFDLS